MTPLLKRMTEDLQLKGMSERTQEMYVRAVRKLVEHCGKSPCKITEEDLRDYFLNIPRNSSFKFQIKRYKHGLVQRRIVVAVPLPLHATLILIRYALLSA